MQGHRSDALLPPCLVALQCCRSKQSGSAQLETELSWHAGRRGTFRSRTAWSWLQLAAKRTRSRVPLASRLQMLRWGLPQPSGKVQVPGRSSDQACLGRPWPVQQLPCRRLTAGSHKPEHIHQTGIPMRLACICGWTCCWLTQLAVGRRVQKMEQRPRQRSRPSRAWPPRRPQCTLSCWRRSQPARRASCSRPWTVPPQATSPPGAASPGSRSRSALYTYQAVCMHVCDVLHHAVMHGLISDGSCCTAGMPCW